MTEDPVRVLFVCLGNICRSPMAEAVFIQKVAQAGLAGKIIADSAGTGSWHAGKPPHVGTRRLLESKGVPYAHSARVVHPSDFDSFGYILGMDEDNIATLHSLGSGSATVSLFLSYAPGCGVTDVPDPYYTGNFEEVFALIDAAADGLLSAIRRERGL